MKTAQQMADMITKSAAGCGLKTHEIFDRVIELIYHCCAISASGDRTEVEQHASEIDALNASILKAGMPREMLSGLINEMTESCELARGDFFGDVAAILSTLDSSLGQFFTPSAVSRLCAELTIPEEEIHDLIRKNGFISSHEPTVGGGSMVLALAEKISATGYEPSAYFCCDCTELEPSTFRMCYAQFSLRCIPAVVRLGDVLTREERDVKMTAAMVHRFLPAQEFASRWRNLFQKIAA